MYEATVTLKYTSKWTGKGDIYDDEILPEENFTFEVPAQDLNSIQLFSLFRKFMFSMGHNQQGIDKGALSLVFNDMRSMEDMRKAAEEYDLVMIEDYNKEMYKLEAEIRDLKAKLSRCQQPDNPNYTESEIEAMTADGHYKEWNGLVPGSTAAELMGCKCPVMDNEEMPDDRKWVNDNCPLHGKTK